MVHHTIQTRVHFVIILVLSGHKIIGHGLIIHGLALCYEYTHRYAKIHSCQHTIEHAIKIFPPQDNDFPKSFTRAMPDEFKHDTSIDTFTAYKNYISSKPWVASNYLRDPSRKPHWL